MSTLVGVVGTHTEVGKTWVTSNLARELVARGLKVAARKPAQSFEPDSGATDAEQLAAATGESVHDVCPSHRWYPRALAPPMAIDILGGQPLRLADLLAEIRWPPAVDVRFIETVGGVRSPIAHDADSIDLIVKVAVDEILLVADAGLGTLNAVRLTSACLPKIRTTVFLNRYDAGNDLHRRNREWLIERDRMEVVTEIQALAGRY
jgi:dethiobiotin synthetase